MDKDEKIAKLEEIIRQQAAHIEALTQEIAELRLINAELREKLNKNSQNSSKPPSSDGLTKPKPRSLRKRSGKKAGTQQWHEVHGLCLPEITEEPIVHTPAQCENCPLQGKCESCDRSETRNVIDVEITTKVMPHYTQAYACPLRDGEIISGKFPDGVNSSV